MTTEKEKLNVYEADKAALETGDDAAYEAAADVFEAILRAGYKNILNKLTK